jgi:hypothetical protein
LLEPTSRIDSHPKSGTTVGKKHTTDSGSLAVSESRPNSKSQAEAATGTVTTRTTASHNIATKAGNLISKKNKGKGRSVKGKQKDSDKAPNRHGDFDTGINLNLSDEFEDDSHEREAALSSPIKGKTSREINKVS